MRLTALTLITVVSFWGYVATAGELQPSQKASSFDAPAMATQKGPQSTKTATAAQKGPEAATAAQKEPAAATASQKGLGLGLFRYQDYPRSRTLDLEILGGDTERPRRRGMFRARRTLFRLQRTIAY